MSLKCIVRMNSATNPLDVRSRYIEVMDELGDIICISLNGYGNQSKSYEEIFLPGNLVIFDFLRIFKGMKTKFCLLFHDVLYKMFVCRPSFCLKCVLFDCRYRNVR